LRDEGWLELLLARGPRQQKQLDYLLGESVKQGPPSIPPSLRGVNWLDQAHLYQSPTGWRFTTRVLLRIVNRPAGFSASPRPLTPDRGLCAEG